MIRMIRIGSSALLSLLICSFVFAQDSAVETEKPTDSSTVQAEPAAPTDFSRLKTGYVTGFESVEDWSYVDDGWKQKPIEGGSVLSLYKKKSNYKPKHRSPLHIALLKDQSFGDFQLDVQIYSTHTDYPHRDVCLFFGYTGPNQYYYVHLGKVADDKCNQIFIVNNADRKKISTSSTPGTAWDGQWHDVRIQRDTASGDIRIYFDDMTTPVMTASDKTFTSGQIGVGSFDDTADYDNLRISSPSLSASK